jgi:hypothetical protein
MPGWMRPLAVIGVATGTAISICISPAMSMTR